MLRMLASMTIIFFAVVVLPASAAEFGTRDEAVAMVKRVQAKFKTEGAERDLQGRVRSGRQRFP